MMRPGQCRKTRQLRVATNVTVNKSAPANSRDSDGLLQTLIARSQETSSYGRTWSAARGDSEAAPPGHRPPASASEGPVRSVRGGVTPNHAKCAKCAPLVQQERSSPGQQHEGGGRHNG